MNLRRFQQPNFELPKSNFRAQNLTTIKTLSDTDKQNRKHSL